MPHLPPFKHLLFSAALALLAIAPAQAQEKFKVITTFTVIADMAQNVAAAAIVNTCPSAASLIVSPLSNTRSISEYRRYLPAATTWLPPLLVFTSFSPVAASAINRSSVMLAEPLPVTA